MQLVEIGRNEPCPCGSGRKYKKCCLAKRDAAVVRDSEIVAAVDRAIEEDDWEPLYGRVDAAMALFAQGAPLEHVRFSHDHMRSRAPAGAELAAMCTAGWLRRCELEIAYVLDRCELDDENRDGLRLALYLLRRFGAKSPTVEELAKLQRTEHVTRVRRLANVVSGLGLTVEEVMAGRLDLREWIERVRPTVLSFAEWLVLRTMSGELFDELWFSGIAMSVCDRCLDQVEDPSTADEDRRRWLDLAAVTVFVQTSRPGRLLVLVGSPRQVTADEQLVYQALSQNTDGEKLRGVLHRILRETEIRGAFADAALLRAAVHSVQSARR